MTHLSAVSERLVNLTSGVVKLKGLCCLVILAVALRRAFAHVPVLVPQERAVEGEAVSVRVALPFVEVPYRRETINRFGWIFSQ